MKKAKKIPDASLKTDANTQKAKNIIERPSFSQKTQPNRQKMLWLEEYTSLKDFKKHHISETYVEKLAQEYVDWVDNNPNEIRNSKFYQARFIPRQTFMDWVKKYEPLIRAHEYVYDILADRREDLAVNYNPSLSLKIIAHYHNVWREVEEWRAKIRSESNDSSQQNVIVLSDIEYKQQVEGK